MMTAHRKLWKPEFRVAKYMYQVPNSMMPSTKFEEASFYFNFCGFLEKKCRLTTIRRLWYLVYAENGLSHHPFFERSGTPFRNARHSPTDTSSESTYVIST